MLHYQLVEQSYELKLSFPDQEDHTAKLFYDRVFHVHPTLHLQQDLFFSGIYNLQISNKESAARIENIFKIEICNASVV